MIGLFHDTPHWDWYVTGSLSLRVWQASGLPKVTSKGDFKRYITWPRFLKRLGAHTHLHALLYILYVLPCICVSLICASMSSCTHTLSLHLYDCTCVFYWLCAYMLYHTYAFSLLHIFCVSHAWWVFSWWLYILMHVIYSQPHLHFMLVLSVV